MKKMRFSSHICAHVYENNLIGIPSPAFCHSHLILIVVVSGTTSLESNQFLHTQLEFIV